MNKQVVVEKSSALAAAAGTKPLSGAWGGKPLISGARCTGGDRVEAFKARNFAVEKRAIRMG